VVVRVDDHRSAPGYAAGTNVGASVHCGPSG
jgi:hypothetical protein